MVAGAVLVVTRPLRRGARATDETLEAERAELEALKEAKYREIRDAELDYRTGKLSEPDWRALDRDAAGRGGRDPQAAGSVESGRAATLSDRMLDTVLSVLQVIFSVGVIFLVLLHSGKDAGMSGAFGVGVAGGSSGGSLMERNLDRWTIVFAVLFAVNIVLIIKQALGVTLRPRSARACSSCSARVLAHATRAHCCLRRPRPGDAC